MTVREVGETVTFGGVAVQYARVKVELVADADLIASGYTATETIADLGWYTTDSTGAWSCNLEPNANITPANTAYRITRHMPHGDVQAPVYVTVPDTAGPHKVSAILTSAPTALAAPISFDPTDLITFATTDDTVAEAMSRVDAYRRPTGPDAWEDELRTFKLGWANRASARCDILLVADSIGQGWTSTTAANRWFDVMMAKLQTVLGQSFAPGYCAVGLTSAAVAYTGRLWTTSGTVTQNTDIGLGYSNCSIASGGYAELAQTCDRIWVHYPTFDTLVGGLRVTIDGGANNDLTLYNGVLPTLGGNVWDSGALSEASHTVRCAPSGATTTRVEGATFFRGNYSSGIAGFNGAHFGYRYAHFAATGSSSWWTDNLGVNINPKLVIWALGVNEQGGGYAASTIETNMATAIARVNTVMAANGKHAPSHLVVAPYGTGTTAAASDDYRAAVWRGALTNGAACVDWSSVFGYVGTAAADDSPAGYDLMSAADGSTSKKHPNDKGHKALGEMMANYLLSAVGYAS